LGRARASRCLLLAWNSREEEIANKGEEVSEGSAQATSRKRVEESEWWCASVVMGQREPAPLTSWRQHPGAFASATVGFGWLAGMHQDVPCVCCPGHAATDYARCRRCWAGVLDASPLLLRIAHGVPSSIRAVPQMLLPAIIGVDANADLRPHPWAMIPFPLP
jgi:hypothetical protein